MLGKSADTFDDLVQLIGKYGAYQAPRTASYSMAVCINRLGGWPQVCSWRYQDLERQRKIFNIVRREVNSLLGHPSSSSLHSVRVCGLHEMVEISPAAAVPISPISATILENPSV